MMVGLIHLIRCVHLASISFPRILLVCFYFLLHGVLFWQAKKEVFVTQTLKKQNFGKKKEDILKSFLYLVPEADVRGDKP